MRDILARTEIFWGTVILFIVTTFINLTIYAGVIDNPTFYIFIVPGVINIYFLLNRKECSKLKWINRCILAAMCVLFVIGVPKYTYRDIESKIKNERFNGEAVKVTELGIRERKIKSMKRPSLLVEDFYRIEFEVKNEEVLNFYINPESSNWVEK